MPNVTQLLGSAANAVFTLKDTQGAEGVYQSSDTAQTAAAAWDYNLQRIIITKTNLFANSIVGDPVLITGCRSGGAAYNIGSGNVPPGVYTIGGIISANQAWLLEPPEWPDIIRLDITGGTLAADGDTITVGGVTYTWKNPFVNAANNIDANVGSLALQLRNLGRAVNRNQTSGTNFGTGTPTNFQFRANTATTAGMIFQSRVKRPSYGTFGLTGAASLAWGTVQRGVGPLVGEQDEVTIRLNLTGSYDAAQKPVKLLQLRCIQGTNPTLKFYDLSNWDINANGADTVALPQRDVFIPDSAPVPIAMAAGGVISWPGGILVGQKGLGYIVGGTATPIFELLWE